MAKKAKSKKAKKSTAARKKPVKKAKKKVAAKKKAVKKSAARKPKKSTAKAKAQGKPAAQYQPAANETKIGEVEDFFARIGVIALTVKAPLSIGDNIHVHGHTTDYSQRVDSMQINHASVQSAKKGDSIGIKAAQRSRKGDQVFVVR